MHTAMERAWDWGSILNLAHTSRFAAQRLTHGVRCDAPDLLSGSADKFLHHTTSGSAASTKTSFRIVPKLAVLYPNPRDLL